MKLVFAQAAWEDYLHWQDTDRKMLKRINALILETTRTPFTGTGKPEGLKHALAGYWSRRINEADRLVYEVFSDRIEFLQARYHY